MLHRHGIKDRRQNFLNGILKQLDTFVIHNRNIQKFNSMTKRQQTNAINFLIYLEKNPIIDIQKTATALNLSYNTVAKNVTSFVDNGILQQTEKSGRAKIYSYVDYLAVLRKNT